MTGRPSAISLLLVLLLMGCGAKSVGGDTGAASTDVSSGGTDSSPIEDTSINTATPSTTRTDTNGPTGDTGLVGPTGDTASPSPRFRIDVLDPVPCRDPAARAAAEWDLVDLDGEPIDFFWLIGVGVGAAQLDEDPELELLRTRDAGVQRFDRLPDGRWQELPMLETPDPSNLSVADYDGDGDRDLFVGGLDQPDRLYANDGNGEFIDVTDFAGLGGPALRTMSASWSDFDRDGDLDLVVGNYGTFPTEIDNAEPSRLFLNEGDGTFTDISTRLPLEVQQGYVFMTGWFDVNRDGWPDLFSVHDYFQVSHSRLLIADGTGGFLIDEGSLFHDSFFGMGFAAQDVNDDGVPDTLQSGFNRISLLQSSPSADAVGGNSYIEYSAALGLSLLRGATAGDPTQTFGWGTAWQDLDNDTDLDIAMTFGDWQPELDGALGRPMNPHPDALWVREGDTFVEVAAAQGFDDDRTNRGLAVADVDRNGWLDLLVATQDGPTTLRTGRCGDAHWTNIRVKDETTANSEAIGATVTVWTGDRKQGRWITAGSSSMFSAEPAEAHFGLNDASVIDELVVVFPDGEEAAFRSVPTNAFILVTRSAI